MSDAPEQIVDAILARDGLQLSDEEHARLVDLYAELRPQLATLWISEARDREPAAVFHT
jgi:hypothetical protein